MANSREQVVLSAMDQLLSRVRRWRPGPGPVGQHQAQELCQKHKDDIYKCFQDSGLQAWEFHAMLHRAAEYGLVEDMKGLWSEVGTTFLQMRSGYGSLEPSPPQQQHMPGLSYSQTAMQQQQQMGAAKANGLYAGAAAYQPNGRSLGSSNGSKPPGLVRQPAPGQGATAAYGTTAAAARSPQDDVAGTNTDQHSRRKQQQQQQQPQPQQQHKPVGRNGSASSMKGIPAAPAAAAGGQQQAQQQRGIGSTGKQPMPAAVPSAAGHNNKLAGTGVPAADTLPNGLTSAWRNGLDSTGSKGPGSLMASGYMPGAALQQQQQQGMEQQQQQEEPLDLLPLGLLDDVYDQGDAVVEAPGAGAAAARGGQAASAKQQQQGKQQLADRQRTQQQQQQQQGRRQQKAAPVSGSSGLQQQQQQAQGRGPAAASANGNQQQTVESLAMEGLSVNGPLSPNTRPFAAPLALGSFSSQQQQPQQQLGFDLTSPLAGMQQRASLEALQQQQQLLMLQQQARMYQQQQQQQQMGMWGPAGSQVPFMQNNMAGAAPGMPMQPPPPPRSNMAAAAAAGGSSAAPGAGAPAGAAASGAPQQQQAKPGYAAVAAGLSTAAGSGSSASGPTAAGSSGDAGGMNMNDVGGNSAAGLLSYRGSLGLSAAPGGPLGASASQQQQLAGLSGSLGQDGGSLLSAGAPAGHVGAQQLGQGSHPQQQQQQGLLGLQQQPGAAAAAAMAAGLQLGSSAGGSKGLMPGGLSLFQGASSYDSPLNGPLGTGGPLLGGAGGPGSNAGPTAAGAAAVGGPLSPYPSPLHRSLSGAAAAASAGTSPAMSALGAAGPQGSTGLGMAPMLLPPSALGAIGEPVAGHHAPHQQQQAAAAAPRSAWAVAPGRPVHGDAAAAMSGSGGFMQVAPGPPQGPPQHQQEQQQQQQSHMQVGSLGSSHGSARGGLVPDSSSSSAASSVTAPQAATSPHSMMPDSSMGAAHGKQQQQMVQEVQHSQQHSQQQQHQGVAGGSPVKPQQQQQVAPSPPSKAMTWAQKLKRGEVGSGPAAANGPAAAQPRVTPGGGSSSSWGACPAGAGASHVLNPSSSGGSSGPRIAPAPKSELGAGGGSGGLVGSGGSGSRGQHKTTGQALLAAAKQQEEEAAAAAAAAVPTYSEAAALEGLDETTAKAAVTAASRMPLPAKLIQAWRSGMCLGSLIKLLQSQRPDLATAVNDRIKGWLCQDCDRSTAECLVLFVLANLRRDWHMTAKNPGAFLMGLLQHRAALIGSSGLSRKLLETARNFPNVAVYIDSDVLQELGDMEPELRGFVMDEYMCKQRHDWPEGLKFPSQCLLSCMRSIRYADPAVHSAYVQLLASRPDLSKACNGVILYGLCKCDKATGLAAVKRLSELPEAWTSAARVNASAFLYQKVQELCGGHGCY